MDISGLPAYSFTPLSAGVDWLTATARGGKEGRAFRELQNALRDDERAAGGDVKPATLRDYIGYRGEGWFVGRRPSDSLTIISGARCAALYEKFARTATNVSRLDLQVTVWTHGEQPTLAREAYHYLRSLPPQRGRPRNLTLIQSHPKGETLNVNRRTSDAYGRLYDWSAAHTQGEARTLWRYEVEFKRHYAAAQARAALGASCLRTYTSHTVHSWFKVRGLPPTWNTEELPESQELAALKIGRDELGWFKSSLRITLTKAINRHGLPAVLEALGLSDLVEPRRRSLKGNGSNANRSVPSNHHRKDP